MITKPATTPQEQLVDCLAFQAVFINELLFLARGGRVEMSAASAQNLYQGLTHCVQLARAMGPMGVPTPPPPPA